MTAPVDDALTPARAGRLPSSRALAGLARESARRAWQAGDLQQAATPTRACSGPAPDRAPLWQRRQKATGAATARPAAAGTGPGRLALQQIREHNRAPGFQLPAREVGGERTARLPRPELEP